MYKIKIFINEKGSPTELEKDFSKWVEENKQDGLTFKDIKFSMVYDGAIDEYVLSLLVLYED